MAESITVDGVSISSNSTGVPPESVEWVESAYLGEVGSGRFTYEDTIGTTEFVGHKTIAVTQSLSSNSRIYTGFVARKSIKRGATTNRLAQRDIMVTTADLNDLLGRIQIADRDGLTAAQAGNRPAETVSARLTWLLASPFLSTLVGDYGAVTYNTDIGMDAADLRGSYPGDALAAMAKACRYNYYVRYNGGALAELVFRDDNASTADTSTISISNVDGAADNVTVFAPSADDEVTQDPEHVYSHVRATYSRGAITEERAATEAAFVERWGSSDDAGDKTAATARRNATAFLWESRTEEQLATVRLRVPKESIGLIRAGDRISTRLTFATPEGWDPAIYARILRKRITQPLGLDDHYDVGLDLSPQEDAPPAAGIVQSVFSNAGEAGTNLTLPNPVTVGNLLVFVNSDRGISNPAAPNTSVSQPRFGAGAWTKLPNSQASHVQGGVAIWYKTADSTEHIGYVGSSNANLGLYEISGATVAGATTDYQHNGTNTTDQDMGSLGTVTDGAIAIMVQSRDDQQNYDDPAPPSATPAAGWTTDLFGPAFNGPVYVWSSPITLICHATGTGAALQAQATWSALLHRTGGWCGAVVVLEPA